MRCPGAIFDAGRGKGDGAAGFLVHRGASILDPILGELFEDVRVMGALASLQIWRLRRAGE